MVTADGADFPCMLSQSKLIYSFTETVVFVVLFCVLIVLLKL